MQRQTRSPPALCSSASTLILHNSKNDMAQNPTCTIHLEDEVHCRVAGLRSEHHELLWEKFGVFVDGYFHMPSFQLRRWDGKIRFYDKHGNTYSRILDEILPYICTWGYEVEIVDKRIPAPVITDRIDENFFGMDSFKLRPYQVDVVNALLDEGSGFAICATGAGKTSMCAALSMVLHINGLQTLIIVPSTDLVAQTVNEFREKLAAYPVSIGEYSGGAKDIDHPIVVATWQSLQNVPHYMSYFQAVIVDEAHGAKAEVIKQLINDHGKHISHRYACTGTFPKPQVDQYSLKLSIGRIVREVRAKWLIEQGYLSEIMIEPMETYDEDPELPDYSSERSYLTKHEERNQALAGQIQELRAKYGNTMVLVNTQSLQQGREIASLIPDAVYLDGGSKNTLRQEEYMQYAERNDVLIIASAGIAATGISIDRIFCLVLLDPGKSFVKCIQAVGRGLRRKGDKNKIYVVDIYSRLKYAKKHWKDRLKFYTEAEYPTLKVTKLHYK
jgi:superfamily II DNA or RNA helicase